MSETTTTPEGLAYITCLYDDGRAEQCGAMVEDTDDARRAHRAFHANEKSVRDGFRSALSRRDAKVTELERMIADLRRDMGRIVVPTPVLPVKRSASGWSDDDEPDTTIGLEDLGLEEPTAEQVFDEGARADAEAAFAPAPQVDPSALYTAGTGSYGPNGTAF